MNQTLLLGNQLIGRLWQTLNFAADVRARLNLLSPHLLAINLQNTGGAALAGFARRWAGRDPSVGFMVDFKDAPKCLEPNVQIRRELSAEDFEEVSGAGATPSLQVRELAGDICSTFVSPIQSSRRVSRFGYGKYRTEYCHPMPVRESRRSL